MSFRPFAARKPSALGPVLTLEDRTVPAAVLLLDNANNLLRVESTAPATIQSTTAVTGLTPGETLVGIDVRPATGEVYGLGATFTGGAVGSNTLTTYAINPTTGAATPRGTAVVANILGATNFGFDFNPVPDRIRVTTDLTSDGSGAGSNVNNFRLNPNNGALVAIDPDLDATALPGGATNLPETAVAYSNSFSGSTAATLYGIVTNGDRLVQNTGGPGFATLADVGPLGVVTTTSAAGFDISGQNNTAIAVLRGGGLSRLYSVNLATGAATALGTVGSGIATITDLTILSTLTPTVAGGRPDGSVVVLTPTTSQSGGGAPVTGQLTAGPTLNLFTGEASNVRTATGDVNGDGIDDIIAVTGPAAANTTTQTRVTVLSGADLATVLVPAFVPFEGFVGGGFVSAGDFNGDGRAEFVVTPDRGGGPRVSVYSLLAGQTTATLLANFFTIDPNFRGGARSAVGRVNADATPDLAVAAGFGGGPRVTLIDGTRVLTTNGTNNADKLVSDFFVFPDVLRNGVYIAIGDVNADGFGDLVIGAGPGGGPRLQIISGQTLLTQGAVAAVGNPLSNFFVGGTDTDRGGVRVSVNDLDGDNRADVVTGTGEARPSRVRAYLGKNFNFAGTAEPTVFQDVDPFSATLADGVYVG